MNYTIEELKKVIPELRKKDQEILYQEKPDFNEFGIHSLKCYEILKEAVENYGAISKSKFGDSVSFDAWLLVQHMDKHLDFQEKYLNLMLEDPDDFIPRNIAYLTDRVLSNKGKPQIYGTQFEEGKGGKMRPMPTIDPKEVNNRRAFVGLEPIEEYATSWDNSDLSDFYNQ